MVDPPERYRLAQAQDSLDDQMLRVWQLAIEHGEYDAADWIWRNYRKRAPAE